MCYKLREEYRVLQVSLGEEATRFFSTTYSFFVASVNVLPLVSLAQRHSHLKPTLSHSILLHFEGLRYRIAGIFRGGKFSRKPLQLYYSNYSRAEFSRNAPSSAKN